MLYKLVFIFFAAAHGLPAAYTKRAKSAERLHALEKELDALQHVAPEMERRTCIAQCTDAIWDSLAQMNSFGTDREGLNDFLYTKWEKNNAKTAKLTELGEKLLGLEPWPLTA